MTDRDLQRFRFVGFYRCLDFVNSAPSRDGKRSERIGSFADLVSWLREARLIDSAGAGKRSTDGTRRGKPRPPALAQSGSARGSPRWRKTWPQSAQCRRLRSAQLTTCSAQAPLTSKCFASAADSPSASEQNRHSESENQMFVTAGHLQTRYGTPMYMVFERNANVGRQPLYCVHAGSDISAPALPTPPEIPAPPELARGAEIVMFHEHILQENAERVPFLGGTPPVSQMCAVSGAIQWSLNRSLQIAYWYYGQMNYLVPLYMQSRENITRAPDLIAPIQVTPETLIVRTVLLPHMPYANARVAVKRHDQLPAWMLDAWNAMAEQVTAQQIENLEPEPTSAST